MNFREYLNETEEYKKNIKKPLFAIVQERPGGEIIIRKGISFDTAFYDWKNSKKKVAIAYMKNNKMIIIPEDEYIKMG